MTQPYSSLTLHILQNTVVLVWKPEDQSQEMVMEAVDALLRNIQQMTQAAGVNLERNGEIESIERVVGGEVGEVQVVLWGSGRLWEGRKEVKLVLKEDGMVLHNHAKVAISEVKLDQLAAFPPAPTVITPTQLSQMQSPQPCIALNGKVYDISKYHRYHPGGRVILSMAGKDATEAFSRLYVDSAHPWVRVESQQGVRLMGVLARK